VNNNPINFNDPTGHNACEDSFYGCSKNRANTSNVNPGSLVYWKWAISSEYGITLQKGPDFDKEIKDDAGRVIDTIHYHGRDWDLENARIADFALGVASLAGFGGTRGATLNLYDHPDGAGHYGGFTSLSSINFFTSSTIPYQNFHHEYGHLLDFMNGRSYSKALANNPHYSSDGTYLWGGSLIGEINTDALLFSGKVDDPNWGAGSMNAIQHPSNDPEEQWGDIYANYVIGNIKDQALTNYVDGGSIGR
jgi:hypothetical protein